VSNAATTTALPAMSCQDMLASARTAMQKTQDFVDKHPESTCDIVVMTDERHRLLKMHCEELEATDPHLGALRLLLGIPIETYLSQGECIARAKELVHRGFRVMLVEELTP